MLRVTLSFIVLMSLMSCGRNVSYIQTDVQSSIEANAESITHADWEASNFHPQFLFENVRQDLSESAAAESDKDNLKTKKEMCLALSNLSDDSLLIFENEINNADNSDLLQECKLSLTERLSHKNNLNRINIQYSTNALSAAPSNIDFDIETKVIDSADYLNFNKYTGSVGDKEIILTFDDGPHNAFTASILKTLKEAGHAKAMFFELGKQIEKYPYNTKSVFADGHVVANHSWSHLCLNSTETCKKNNKGKLLSDEEVTSDIMDTFRMIQKTIGKVAPFFRFPYGDNRKVTSEYLKKYGIHEMHWSIDSNDWRYVQKVGTESIPFTSKEVLTSALTTLDKNNKGVVLFHDIHRRTAEILPQFLYELHKRHFKLVIFDPKNTAVNLSKIAN